MHESSILLSGFINYHPEFEILPFELRRSVYSVAHNRIVKSNRTRTNIPSQAGAGHAIFFKNTFLMGVEKYDITCFNVQAIHFNCKDVRETYFKHKKNNISIMFFQFACCILISLFLSHKIISISSTFGCLTVHKQGSFVVVFIY